ncbi:hypothetical protein Droror1_Dr00024250 [Drosera rotundifolia]
MSREWRGDGAHLCFGVTSWVPELYQTCCPSQRRFLLINGADKTLKNKDDLTPLELCLYSSRDTKTYLRVVIEQTRRSQ